MPSRSELVAHNRTTQEIEEEIGADLVIFQTLPDLVSSIRALNPSIKQFDCSVFTGKYVTGGVDEAYLQHLEGLRADNIKVKSMVMTGGLSEMEGKGGGGGMSNGVDPHIEPPQEPKRWNSMSSNDETVGLHNSYNS